eukprot:118602_1
MKNHGLKQMRIVYHNGEEDTAVLNICDQCWIGYSDTKSEATFVTADGTPLDYFPGWCAGNPGNSGPEDDCVAIGVSCWFDSICTTTREFVCNPIAAITNDPTNYPTAI